MIGGQKLASLCEVINDRIVDAKSERVSLPGLFDLVHGRAKGPFHKARWSIEQCPLDSAIVFYEAERAKGFRNALVVGDMSCYKTVPSY